MWNRITALMIIVTALNVLLIPFDVDARGGRGGGGRGGGGRGGGARGGSARGGGGAYRGGRSMNRTPTMSRASSRPAPQRARQQVSRPAASQGRVPQSRQARQQRPSAANRAEIRNQINRYSQGRSVQNIDRGALSQKAQNFSSQRNNQIIQNRRVSENASQRLRQMQPGSNQWFDRNFFDRHNIDLDYVRTRDNWWRPATWATLAGWGAWNWATPYYYDDVGYAYPITIEDTTHVYPSVSGQTYQQPTQAQEVQTTSNEGDWLSLGVFAVASDATTASQANHFIQLALNRSGEIAGVLYNSLTDAAHDLTGMVDPNNQMAYWYMADRTDAPISSTGVYNLTEDQTPINVHFSDGSDQPWLLVRLQQ